MKEKIAELIAKNVEGIEIADILASIEIPPRPEMGDYAFPCFRLAKVMRKAPNMIAADIKDQIGDVDFIFGGSTALFYQCQIHSILKNASPFETNGYCCAPSHSLETRFGYLFYKCNFTCDKGTKNVFLARPWRDYGYATFIDSDYAEHIVPEGFNKWNNTNRDKTARFYEYSNKYDLSKRVPWAHILTENEKEKYIYEYFKYINFKE